MTTVGHVFIPLDRAHDGTVPTCNDQTHFESLPVPVELWEPFQQRLSKHLSELTEGQIDREEKFWFAPVVATTASQGRSTSLRYRQRSATPGP